LVYIATVHYFVLVFYGGSYPTCPYENGRATVLRIKKIKIVRKSTNTLIIRFYYDI